MNRERERGAARRRSGAVPLSLSTRRSATAETLMCFHMSIYIYIHVSMKRARRSDEPGLLSISKISKVKATEERRARTFIVFMRATERRAGTFIRNMSKTTKIIIICRKSTSMRVNMSVCQKYVTFYARVCRICRGSILLFF